MRPPMPIPNEVDWSGHVSISRGDPSSPSTHLGVDVNWDSIVTARDRIGQHFSKLAPAAARPRVLTPGNFAGIRGGPVELWDLGFLRTDRMA